MALLYIDIKPGMHLKKPYIDIRFKNFYHKLIWDVRIYLVVTGISSSTFFHYCWKICTAIKRSTKKKKCYKVYSASAVIKNISLTLPMSKKKELNEKRYSLKNNNLVKELHIKKLNMKNYFLKWL